MFRRAFLLVFLFVGLFGLLVGPNLRASQPVVQVIVQGSSVTATTAAVSAQGGTVISTLASIHAVVAQMPQSAAEALVAAGLRVTPDQVVISSAARVPVGPGERLTNTTLDKDSYPSTITGANEAHRQGLTGKGVTVAVIDSGMPSIQERWTRLGDNTLRYEVTGGTNPWRIIYKDVTGDRHNINDSDDPYGHGTHVIGTIADGRRIPGGAKFGVAPDANLVVVRALDANGQAPYSKVIEAIDWIIANQDFYNIKVLNLSIQAPVHGPYWHDPLAQAAMAAWQAGLTVVVAAGNEGPSPATITVPGNVPYVITVGAVRPGMYTNTGIDELPYYSSTGPTESKFIKPDVVIAGSRVIAPMPSGSSLAPAAGLARETASMVLPGMTSQDPLNYYYLSGTSMSAAEVSGVAALLLQDEPGLTNNQIKARLTSSADLATDGLGNPVFSIWQQGAGRVNVLNAINSTRTDSANAGMDIALDRNYENGTHYMGVTTYDQATNSFNLEGHLLGMDSYLTWDGSYQSWAGSYQSWAGSYQSWAGSYQSWAGSTSVWDSSYQSWAGNLVQE